MRKGGLPVIINPLSHFPSFYVPSPSPPSPPPSLPPSLQPSLLSELRLEGYIAPHAFLVYQVQASTDFSARGEREGRREGKRLSNQCNPGRGGTDPVLPLSYPPSLPPSIPQTATRWPYSAITLSARPPRKQILSKRVPGPLLPLLPLLLRQCSKTD